MPRWYGFTFVFVLLISTLAHGEENDQTTAQIQATLPNGMRVVVQSVPWERLARVEMFYCAGAATDPDSMVGLAHLSEHILTNSSKNHPDGELHRLQTLYSTYTNAYTGASSMRFISRCLPDFVPHLLDLEVERMHGAVTDSISFEREKRVVLEELAYRNRLSARLEFLLSTFRTAYPGHPFARDIGGTQKAVSQIQLGDFYNFQEERIQPQKAVLVISGPVNAQETLELIQEKFNFASPADPFIPTYPQYPEVATNQVIQDAHNHTGFKVGLACRIPLDENKDYALAFSLKDFLDDSWLRFNLWAVPGEAVFMANLFRSYYRAPTNADKQYSMSYADFDPDDDAQIGLRDLWMELDETLFDLRQTKAFNKARRRALDRVERLGRASSSGSGAGQAMVNGNRYLDNETMIATIKRLQPGDLQNFAQMYLNPERAVIGVSHGSDSERSATINLPSRVAPQSVMNTSDTEELLGQDLIEPVLEIYARSKLFQFEKTTLPNGVPVHCLVLPDAEQWHLGGCRTFPYLKDLRQSKKAGLSQLYNWVVDYDYNQKKNFSEDEAPRKLPYHLSFSLSAWELKFRASGLPKNATKVAVALDQRLLKDQFNTSRWGSIMRRGNERLVDFGDSKEFIARAWRWGQLLGEDHPALSLWAPKPETADSIKYRDLEKIHDKVAGEVGNTVLFAAGPLNSLETESILKGKFWPKETRETDVEVLEIHSKIIGNKGQVFPSLGKSDVRLSVSLGPIPMQSEDPSFGTAVLLFQKAVRQSLLLQLREKGGLTYTATSHVHPLSGMMILDVSASCQSGQAHIAMASIKRTLDHHGQNGFTPDELARARLALTGSAIASYSHTGGALESLHRLATFGKVPTDPVAMIFKISSQQVNAIAHEFLNTDNFVFTATGPMFQEDIDQFTFDGP